MHRITLASLLLLSSQAMSQCPQLEGNLIQGGLVWGEVPAMWTIAGASLILTGLVLRYVVLGLLAGRRAGGS